MNLNIAVEDSAESGNDSPKSPEKKTKETKLMLSARSVFFVICSSFFSAVCLVDLLMCITLEQNETVAIMHGSHVALRFFLYFLQMLAMSALPQLPKEQPYRFIMLSARFIVFLFGFDELHHVYSVFLTYTQ